ncbi:hypothetical protein ACFVZ3_32980 [Kitasatospora purpeofusca]|uniref:hypothetical protein n=1 Tax=Kitasatospora purpeofusca TaxID=67352 RepID=UPI00367849A2
MNRIHRLPVLGWTVTLGTYHRALHVALTRPRPLDPDRWDGPVPAWALVARGGLAENDPTEPAPEPVRLRDWPRRLWQRWANRHPDVALQAAGTHTLGPWAATLNHDGLSVRRLPEYDCSWHAPITDEECCATGRYVYQPEPQLWSCTCPRVRPWVRICLTRPELQSVEPPF